MGFCDSTFTEGKKKSNIQKPCLTQLTYQRQDSEGSEVAASVCAVNLRREKGTVSENTQLLTHLHHSVGKGRLNIVSAWLQGLGQWVMNSDPIIHARVSEAETGEPYFSL